MKLKKASYPQPVEGLYEAIIGSIVEIGTVENKTFKNKAFKISVSFQVENPNSVNSEGEEQEPFFKTLTYTPSAHSKSSFRKDFEHLLDFDSEEVDITELLGKKVSILLKQTGDYLNIDSVLSAKNPKRTKEEMAIEPFYFSLEKPELAAWMRVPEFLKKRIAETPEGKEVVEVFNQVDTNDLPF